ncbi:MAG: Uma2 family endonuclease [Cyanobacteria bacterium P01_F01_bin.143]
MVQTPAKTISLEEFLQLPETKPAKEYIDGQIIPKPMPQGHHSTIQVELTEAINAVVKKQRIARAYTELRCIFGGLAIVPDITVFAWSRIPVDDKGNVENIFNLAPDWIIEILSPGQNQTKVTGKILHSLNHGSQMGWLIDPEARSVLIYPPQQQPQLLQKETAILPPPELVKNLSLTVGDLFGWLKHH